MNKKILIFIFIFLFLYFISGYFYYSKIKIKTIIYSGASTPSKVLMEKNKDYSVGMFYEREKKYDLALSFYNKALLSSVDQYQSTQIKIRIAVMNEWLGNYVEAISLLKAIASDKNNHATVRAFAVQEIGYMNIYTMDKVHDLVTYETFKDEPYSSFKDKNKNITYLNLFKYSSDMYPLAYSNAYIAYTLSGEIISTLNRSTTTEKAISYISSIKQNIKDADKDIDRMKINKSEGELLQVSRVWEGITLSRLASVGVVDPKEAEFYFKEGLEYGLKIGDKPGSFNSFNYAAYLSYHYGTTRLEDIKKLLLPFREGNESQIYDNIINFYKNIRVDKKNVGDKIQVVRMAKIDNDFKNYLIFLGWKESDFK